MLINYFTHIRLIIIFDNNFIFKLFLEKFTPKSDIQISVRLEKLNDKFDNYVVYSKLQKQKVIKILILKRFLI